MRLRTFKISTQQALRLSNRAVGCNKSSADLVREYIDKFLTNPVIVAAYPYDTLRSYHLTVEQDKKLEELATSLGVTKGLLFRIAIDKGLGTPDFKQ